MLEGKFKCVQSSGNDDYMIMGRVYEFVKGRFTREDGRENICRWDSVGHFNQGNMNKIELYIEPDQPKTLSNSELWKLAEDYVLRDNDKFEAKIGFDKIHYYKGYFYDELDKRVDFNVDDKWIPIPRKPRLSKCEAEEQFGVEIVD